MQCHNKKFGQEDFDRSRRSSHSSHANDTFLTINVHTISQALATDLASYLKSNSQKKLTPTMPELVSVLCSSFASKGEAFSSEYND